MTAFAFFSSLISFASIGSWIIEPLMGIALAIDGLIFTLVSYSFKLFLLMCQINFDSLYGIISGLLDSLQAVVMVLVVYKIATELISYLINPDQAMKGGKELLKNIAISAALLILYPFIFGVMNEVSILIMGNDTNYSFPILGRIADLEGGNDEGIIMRFLFGEDINDLGGDVGDYLAYSTMTIFIHDTSETSGNSNVRSVVCPGDDCDFHNLPNLVSKIGKQVEYHWGVSALLGLFLVYSIARNAIEIGIRMFKMLILQMLAPVAIITIIKDGTKGKVFSNYVKMYFSTWAQAFIRMLTLLLVTVFVCKFYLSIGDFFGDNLTADTPRITKLLLTAIIVFAAYRFAGQVPQFIGDVLGTKLDGGSMGGFGHMVGGLVGGTAGAIGGLTAGLAGGAGLLGSVGNMVAGGVHGAGSGSRANSVAEFFRNNGENTAASRQRARQISAAGGGLRYAGHAVENALGITAARQARVQTEQDRLNRLQNYDNALNEHMGRDEANNMDFGSDRDAYVRSRQEAAANAERNNQQQLNADRLRRLTERRQAAYAALQANNGNLGATVNLRGTSTTIQSELNSIAAEERAINSSIDTAVEARRASVEGTAGADWDNRRTEVIQEGHHDVQTARRALNGSNSRGQRALVDNGQSRQAISEQRGRLEQAQQRGSLERQNRQNLGN